MGTIASVLQWTCNNCNLINPTECLKCLQCGNVRKIHEQDTIIGGSADDDGGKNDGNRSIDEQGKTTTSKCGDTVGTTKHKTLPGYVEISSNG